MVTMPKIHLEHLEVKGVKPFIKKKDGHTYMRFDKIVIEQHSSSFWGIANRKAIRSLIMTYFWKGVPVLHKYEPGVIDQPITLEGFIGYSRIEQQ